MVSLSSTLTLIGVKFMDNPWQSNPTRKASSHHDESRRQFEYIKKGEQLQKEFNLAKRAFDIYESKIDTLNSKMQEIRSTFENANIEVHQLQSRADILLNRFVNIRSSKKEFIDNIISKAIITKKFYHDLYITMPNEILSTIHPHADANYKKAVKKELSQYLESKGFNHQDFEDVLDILTEGNNHLPPQNMREQLKNPLLEALSPKKVIDAQNQVFQHMLWTNEAVHDKLTNTRSDLGDLDRLVFKKVDPFYCEYDGNRKLEITPAFEVNIDNNYEEISYENNKNSFTSIKKDNWIKFNKNKQITISKVLDFNICYSSITNLFRGKQPNFGPFET